MAFLWKTEKIYTELCAPTTQVPDSFLPKTKLGTSGLEQRENSKPLWEECRKERLGRTFFLLPKTNQRNENLWRAEKEDYRLISEMTIWYPVQ